MRIGLDLLSEVAGRSSGTETYLMGFLKALAAATADDSEVFLFVNSQNARLYEVQGTRFHHVRLPFSNRQPGLRVLSQLFLIPYHARSLGLDVVNFLGTTGAFFAGCATVQHVKTLHHLLCPKAVLPSRALFRRFLMGPSARAADLVIANTESTRGAVIRLLRVPPAQVRVVPEAVDHSIFFPRVLDDQYGVTLAKYRIRRPYLLFVSSLWPYKNVHGFLRACGVLTAAHAIPHSFVVVGGLGPSRYQARLQELANQPNLRGRVLFLGHLRDRREIRDIYVGADVYVQPSYEETFGLTVLEAMACGVPVVAADRGAIPEVAGDAALLVNPDDAKAIADSIWWVISDHRRRQQLKEKGLLRARSFSWVRTAAETLEVYRAAVQIRAKGGRQLP